MSREAGAPRAQRARSPPRASIERDASPSVSPRVTRRRARRARRHGRALRVRRQRSVAPGAARGAEDARGDLCTDAGANVDDDTGARIDTTVHTHAGTSERSEARGSGRSRFVSGFCYVDGELHAEGVALSTVAQRHGTPCYVYSRAMLTANYRECERAFAGMPVLVCYALKANSSLAVVDLFARLGSGFDIVSGGELARVVAAGGDTRRVVFSGVGKSDGEMEAALAAGVLCINVESASELEHLARVASRLGRRAPVSFRVNPDVDAGTHPYISTGLRESKFGVTFEDAAALYRRAAELASIEVRGIDMHIGSQMTELAPIREAATRLLGLVDALSAQGIRLDHVDVGGGVGIRYRDEAPPALADYAQVLRELFRDRRETLVVEPGRRLVGDAGVLLTRVRYLKRGFPRDFAIVDAAMNDLLRPSLYAAWHAIDPVRPRRGEARRFDIVGPVCESADFLGYDRELALAEGDLLAIRSAGAYAMSMSSNYNSRPRACEVMVDGDDAIEIRRRESVADLYALERRLP